jgi:excisionase family DNA binding protein
MQKNATLIHDLTHEELIDLFQELKFQLLEIKKNFEPVKPTEYLTRTELAEMLKCDLSTIHNWTKKGKLIPYGIGNRIYYKRDEVESMLLPLGKKS